MQRDFEFVNDSDKHKLGNRPRPRMQLASQGRDCGPDKENEITVTRRSSFDLKRLPGFLIRLQKFLPGWKSHNILL